MDKLEIYNQAKAVPDGAKKTILGGKLKGMTDINPMWRMKRMTEIFGPVGIGWKYEILDKVLQSGVNGEVKAFVDVNLYVKIDGEWSDAIPGTGGSSYISREKGDLFANDECYKMALTDALSVAMKPLGVGADVYFCNDVTKYTNEEDGMIFNEETAKIIYDSPTNPLEAAIDGANEPKAVAEEKSTSVITQNTGTSAIFARPNPSSNPKSSYQIPETRDEALDFIIKIGKYREAPKPMSDVIALDPGYIDYILSDKFEPGYPYAKALKAAAKLVRAAA